MSSSTPTTPSGTEHHDLSTMLAREPCAGCGAPLGADQRYCLSCGIPRAGTRLPFLDVLHSEAAGVIERGAQPAALLRMPSLPAGAGRGGAWLDGNGGAALKLRENAGLFALLGVLLLALLIGLLLGHWVSAGSSNVASVPAKQVIEVKGLSGAALAPAAVSGEANGASGTGSTGGAAAGGEGSSSSAHVKHAANPTVSKLAQSTGKEHAKAVEKAIQNGGGSLSTGGAPPPKESSKGGASKPIGGGSEVTNIE